SVPPSLLLSFPTRRSSDLSRLHCAQPLRRSLLARRRTSERLGTPRPPFVLQRWPAHTSPCRCIRSQAPNEYGRSLAPTQGFSARSEEHTSELQSRVDLVCR